MSRTYRNRKTVPHGVVVRDDGRVIYSRSYKHWNQRPKFRRGFYSVEKKVHRKAHYREYRAKVKDRMRHEDWEGIPRFRRTGGWLSW